MGRWRGRQREADEYICSLKVDSMEMGAGKEMWREYFENIKYTYYTLFIL